MAGAFGRAEITVSGIFALEDDEETKEVKLADEAKPAIGTAITYEKRRPDWIVVSGTNGHRIFYMKSVTA